MCRLLFLFSVLLYSAKATDKPIIGVLTQELDIPGWRNYSSYLPAVYVMAVESSGARVVPVFMNMTEDYYRNILLKINGIIFPGGSADFHTKNGIADAARIIYRIVLELNSKGDHFPLMGVCQGFELLAFVSNNATDILAQCNSEDVNYPLHFSKNFKNSSIYGEAPERDLRILATLPVTSNHHGMCLTEKNLTHFGLLDNPWKVLSTNRDENGFEFVSSMEHQDYPVVGVQFHPEKNAFEWDPSQNNPHDALAIQSARIFYDWIVRHAGRNNHSYPDQYSEMDALIYNYSPIYTTKLNIYGTQNYFFYEPLPVRYNGGNPVVVLGDHFYGLQETLGTEQNSI